MYNEAGMWEEAHQLASRHLNTNEVGIIQIIINLKYFFDENKVKTLFHSLITLCVAISIESAGGAAISGLVLRLFMCERAAVS